jgi:hypothetical protein
MHLLAVGWRVMLCEVICEVAVSQFPEDTELALVDSLFDPIERHVHGFGAFWFDGIVR